MTATMNSENMFRIVELVATLRIRTMNCAWTCSRTLRWVMSQRTVSQCKELMLEIAQLNAKELVLTIALFNAKELMLKAAQFYAESEEIKS